MKIVFFLLVVFIADLNVLYAEPPKVESEEEPAPIDLDRKIQIDVVLVDGLFRTQKRVVMRELEFGEGSIVTLKQIEEGIQRLRNMGLFRVVEYELSDQRVQSDKPIITKVDHRVIRIHVDETWTLLPFWSFSRGGGALSFVAGLDDLNLFGSYINAGFQYLRFSGTDSFSIYANDPRFLDTHLSFGASLIQRNSLQFSYDDKGNRSDGWLRFRRAINLSLRHKWSDNFSTGLAIGIAGDKFSSKLVPEDVAALKPGVPGTEHFVAYAFSGALGRIDKKKYLKSGIRYRHLFRLLEPSLGSSFRSLESSGNLSGYLVLPWKINIAGRFGAGIQSTTRRNYAYSLGGLGEVRGFLHRRFSGTKYWFANAEFRIPSFDNQYFVFQHIAFLDLAQTGFEDDSFIGLKAASTGLGLRIMVPKIYGFVVRLDYAFPLKGNGQSVLSFGSQQFF